MEISFKGKYNGPYWAELSVAISRQKEVSHKWYVKKGAP